MTTRRKLTLLLMALTFQGCSPSFDLTLEELSCPPEFQKMIEDCASVAQKVTSACPIPGDSEDDERISQ